MRLANRCGWGLGATLVLMFACPVGAIEANPAPDKAQERLAAGKELFTREWIAGDRRSYAGDGLGPVYNARSCVACHHLGGIGGAGGREKNTRIVIVFIARFGEALAGVLPGPDPSPTQPSRDKLAKIHPALQHENFFPLHRFGQGAEHLSWKKSLLDDRDAFGHAADDTVVEAFLQATLAKKVDGINVEMIRSERNVLPLFGAGLIDRIPPKVLENVAAEQAADSKFMVQSDPKRVPWTEKVALPVAGRMARLKDGRVGRFGWKGHAATLHECTMQACANEIGLEVPGFPRATPPWKKDYRAPGLDLSADQCNLLVDFVASLPRPGGRGPETPQHGSEIAAGKKLFATIGCVVCHRPDLGEVRGILTPASAIA